MSAAERSVLVTGGAGFIGSAVCRHLIANGYRVTNVDKLTYAGNLSSLRAIEALPGYSFEHADIGDESRIVATLKRDEIDIVMHLAAESHVDRSIDGPGAFIETNIVGTFRLLNAALEYWRGLPEERRRRFRFHHVSTDESLGTFLSKAAPSRKRRPTHRPRPIPRRKPHRIISREPGTRPTGCRSCSPTVQTIMGPTNFPKS
jgi:dTDP-D-glucose 4,6-dehydratase